MTAIQNLLYTPRSRFILSNTSMYESMTFGEVFELLHHVIINIRKIHDHVIPENSYTRKVLNICKYLEVFKDICSLALVIN